MSAVCLTIHSQAPLTLRLFTWYLAIYSNLFQLTNRLRRHCIIWVVLKYLWEVNLPIWLLPLTLRHDWNWNCGNHVSTLIFIQTEEGCFPFFHLVILRVFTELGNSYWNTGSSFPWYLWPSSREYRCIFAGLMNFDLCLFFTGRWGYQSLMQALPV